MERCVSAPWFERIPDHFGLASAETSVPIVFAAGNTNCYLWRMESGDSPLRARQYLDNLASSSRYTFTTADARAALGLSSSALKVAADAGLASELEQILGAGNVRFVSTQKRKPGSNGNGKGHANGYGHRQASAK